MIDTRFRIIVRRLMAHKGWTALVALVLAAGVMATAIAPAVETALIRDLTADSAPSRPAHAVLETTRFDWSLLQRARVLRVLDDAQARWAMDTRARVGDRWLNLRLFAIIDVDEITIAKLSAESGAWPPPPDQLLLERSSLAWLGVRPGGSIEVETPDGLHRRTLRVAGTARDPAQAPARVADRAAGYISFDTLALLGEPKGYNTLYFRVPRDRPGEDQVAEAAEQIAHLFAEGGVAIVQAELPAPGAPLAGMLHTLLWLARTLGILALALGGTLAAGAIAEAIARQAPQRAAMKVMGATRSQVAGLYLGVAAGYGAAGLGLAFAIGVPVSRLVYGHLARMAAVGTGDFAVSFSHLLLGIAVAFGVPLAAALGPALCAAQDRRCVWPQLAAVVGAAAVGLTCLLAIWRKTAPAGGEGLRALEARMISSALPAAAVLLAAVVIAGLVSLTLQHIRERAPYMDLMHALGASPGQSVGVLLRRVLPKL